MIQTKEKLKHNHPINKENKMEKILIALIGIPLVLMGAIVLYTMFEPYFIELFRGLAVLTG